MAQFLDGSGVTPLPGGSRRGMIRSGPKAANESIIQRSWERCSDTYRIDRVERSDPVVVEAPRLNESMDRYGEFVQLGRAEMHTLYQQIAGSGYALLLTDADGLILDYVGDPTLKREFQGAGLLRGAIWNEESEGTNGVGTCIAEHRPVTVHRDQHFRSRHHGLSCSGAPILDAHGELFAVLDASSVNAKDTPESQLHTLALVTMSAQLIAKCRFMASFPEAMILRFHSRPEYVGLINDAAMAVNGDGVIVAADPNAVAYLGLPSRSELVGKPIDAVLDIDTDQLQDHARRRHMPYWPVRSVNHGTRYYATVEQASERGLPGDRMPGTGRGPVQAPVLERRRPSLTMLGGSDPHLQRQVERAQRVAGRGIPVLLHGETGTGKEVFARALHDSCHLAQASFVAVNCAAIPENLIESELFGYEPGAFTGARKDGRKGKVLQANGGTLFLDEIGDMPRELQTRLLRVLEEHEVVPLGGDKPVQVQLNLVSATHCDLRERVGDGRFREDLYYRLKGFEVQLPALRERQDRRELIRCLLADEGGAGITIADDAMARMMAYDWPGNLRQLRNVLRAAVALCDDNTIRVDDLGSEMADLEPPAQTDAQPSGSALASAERDAIVECLVRHRWNISRTADALEMSRNTLYRKMRRHGIQQACE